MKVVFGIFPCPRRGDGMADMTDSKSVARKGVWVQVPPSVLPADFFVPTPLT